MRREKVKHRAEQLGIELIEQGDCFVLQCPTGYQFADTLVSVWQEVQTHGVTMPHIWQSLFDEMKNGIVEI